MPVSLLRTSLAVTLLGGVLLSTMASATRTRPSERDRAPSLEPVGPTHVQACLGERGAAVRRAGKVLAVRLPGAQPADARLILLPTVGAALAAAQRLYDDRGVVPRLGGPGSFNNVLIDPARRLDAGQRRALVDCLSG